MFKTSLVALRCTSVHYGCDRKVLFSDFKHQIEVMAS